MAVSDASSKPSQPAFGAFAQASASQNKPKKAKSNLTAAERKHQAVINSIAKAAKAGKLENRYVRTKPRGIGKTSKRGLSRISVEDGKVKIKREKPKQLMQKKRLKNLLEDANSRSAVTALFREKACPVFVRSHCRKKRK